MFVNTLKNHLLKCIPIIYVTGRMKTIEATLCLRSFLDIISFYKYIHISVPTDLGHLLQRRIFHII